MKNNQFDEFLEEVEKDIRQERFEKLWHQYGQKIMIAFGAILLCACIYTFWKNHQAKQQQQYSEMFITAQSLVSQGKTTEALGMLEELASTSHKNYQALADFTRASVYARLDTAEDQEKAKKLYADLAQNNAIERYMRDFAQIQHIGMEMNNASADQLKHIVEQLEKLSTEDAPWRLMALEFKGIALKEQGETSKASDVFVSIAQDKNAPQGMRARAQMMLQGLSKK